MVTSPQPRLFPALGWKWNLFFIIVALVEIYLLTVVNDRIGFGRTVLLVLLSAFGGVCLMRWEGNRCWNHILADLSAGKPVLNRMKDGILILAGGILLILPGVMTDLVGLALFFPPFRILVRYLFMKKVYFQLPGSPFTFSDASSGGPGMGPGTGAFSFGPFHMTGFSGSFTDNSGTYPPGYNEADDFDGSGAFDDSAETEDGDESDIYDSECSPHVDVIGGDGQPIQIIDVEAKKPE